uniref:ubiquitinyl hydrolase 1 n=1 Tax=Equus caballus TaxID=9796 RepID=A0A3Q2HFD7_HORSE
MAAEEPQQQKQESLGSDSEGVNCLAYDEAIMAQQDRIQQEIAVQNPLVSERLELSVLYKEYAEDDNIYQQKIKDLHKKYSYIRKTRPDGNCFYRAFGFSHLEALLDDSKELQRAAQFRTQPGAHARLPLSPAGRFKAVSAKSKEDLVSQGFTEFTIEDFHNTVSPATPGAHSARVEGGRPGRGGVDPPSPPSPRPLSPAGAVHGPDRAGGEADLGGRPAGLLQRPEHLGLPGGLPAAAHLGPPAAREHVLRALHRGRPDRQGVLPAGAPHSSDLGPSSSGWGEALGTGRPALALTGPCAAGGGAHVQGERPHPHHRAGPGPQRLHPGGVHGPRRGRHHQPAHLPRGLGAQGLPALPARTLRHPLQIGLARPPPPCLPPLPGARHVQGVFCGCKWSYFTPPPCHTTFHVLLKGMLVVSCVCACPCSAAARLAALCLAVPLPSRWVPLGLPPVHPQASLPGAVLRGSASWGPLLVSGVLLPALQPSPVPSLAGPGASMGIWKFLGDLPRDPGPPRLQAAPS